MARPDSTSQARSPRVSWAQGPPGQPTRKTIPQANTSTTPVRRAVARWEGTDWMPILAKIAVIPGEKGGTHCKQQPRHGALSFQGLNR